MWRQGGLRFAGAASPLSWQKFSKMMGFILQ